jgi:hypothetical protein
METMTNAELKKLLHNALRNFGGVDKPASPLRLLRIFEAYTQRGRSSRPAHPSVDLFLKRSLQAFRELRPEGEILIRRFIQGEGVKILAHNLGASPEHINRSQRHALALYAQWLFQQEQAAEAEFTTRLMGKLAPPSYGRLFGSTAVRRELASLVRKKSAPWVVCLCGLGGLGKTAHIDQVVRKIVAHFPYRELVWIRVPYSPGESLNKEALVSELSARLLPATLPARERPTALRADLKKKPTLVILDNLGEELADAEWLDLLQDLANPSRFVLASRALPGPLGRSYVIEVGELSPAEAKKLMQYELKERGLQRYASQIAKNSEQILARTGGHPLAIKLVIGLLHVWPLDAILDTLTAGSSRDVEQMYAGIYWAAWANISRAAQRLLVSLPLFDEVGATLAQMGAVAKQKPAELRAAVEELRRHSLLELRGSPAETYYGIHQLTRTFLMRDLLKWG